MVAILRVLLSLFILSLLFNGALFGEEGSLDTLLSKNLKGLNTSSVGVAVLELDKGVIYGINKHAAFKPASVAKIATSKLALEELGPNYKFKTDVYVSGRKGSKVSTLTVRGAGDPSLTTEQLWVLAREIRAAGVRDIGKLILDDSFFLVTRERSGQRAYEAGSSALSFNFNSVSFKVCPANKVGLPASLVADLFELPFSFYGSIKTTSSGAGRYLIDEVRGKEFTYRISGSIRRSSKCSRIYRSVRNPLLHFGLALRAFLDYVGVVVRSKEIKRGKLSVNS